MEKGHNTCNRFNRSIPSHITPSSIYALLYVWNAFLVFFFIQLVNFIFIGTETVETREIENTGNKIHVLQNIVLTRSTSHEFAYTTNIIEREIQPWDS